MLYRSLVVVAAFIPWLNGCGSGANPPAPAPAVPKTPKVEQPKIRVDKFEGHVEKVPDGVKISLDTDFPDNTEINVTVSRDFAINEEVGLGTERQTRDVGIFYLERKMTVADAHSTQLVSLDTKVTDEEIKKSVTMASGFHGRLASVSQVVTVSFHFGCNKGYEGAAIKPCDLPLPETPIEALWETKVPAPYP